MVVSERVAFLGTNANGNTYTSECIERAWRDCYKRTPLLKRWAWRLGSWLLRWSGN